MRTTKKLLVLLLAAIMSLTLVACGDSESSVPASNDSKATEKIGGGTIGETADDVEYKNCTMCNGTGEHCVSCTDGKCDYCEGTGGIECGMCNGTGECHLCLGTGTRPDGDSTRDCPICEGGECTSCDGGTNICNKCNGTKKCKNCRGERECIQCDGEGEYAVKKTTNPNPNPNSNPNPNPDDGYVCPLCNNSGYASCTMCFGSGKCSICMGTGYYETTFMGEITRKDCSACSGGICSTCGGDGEERCMCKSYGN